MTRASPELTERYVGSGEGTSTLYIAGVLAVVAGRPLQLIDCQNLFCETDKYARVAHPDVAGRRSRIKQIFAPTASRIEHRYPPKWGLPAEVTASTR